MQMIPRNTIDQLIEDGVMEAIEGGTFAYKPAVEASAAEQRLFAAMSPSWNRDRLIEHHYPEHLRLLSTHSAAKPAAGQNLLASGSAGARNPQKTLIGSVAKPAHANQSPPPQR